MCLVSAGTFPQSAANPQCHLAMGDPDNVIQFTDCLILRNHKLIKEDLWIENGKIIDPGPLFFQQRKSASKKVNCQGNILAPGFIDLQINGAFGLDFT